MKLFIAFTMLLSSTFSLASIDRVLPKEEGAEVMNAIVFSLNEQNLSCKSFVGSTHIKVATEFNWSSVIGAMTGSNAAKYVVEISDDLSQPVIALNIAHSSSNHENIKITTNSEMTLVTKLEYFKKEVKTTTRRVNTGTIINPKFETITDVQETILTQVVCE